MGSGPDKVDTVVFVGIKKSTINSIDVGASDKNAKRYVDGAPKSRLFGLLKGSGANFFPTVTEPCEKTAAVCRMTRVGPGPK